MKFLVAVVVLALTVYAVIDCVDGDPARRKALPTWLWVTLIIVAPMIGAAIWLVVSRSGSGPASSRPPRRQPLPPDDDPAFLADLDRRTRPTEPRNEETDESEPSDDDEEPDEPSRSR